MDSIQVVGDNVITSKTVTKEQKVKELTVALESLEEIVAQKNEKIAIIKEQLAQLK